jgi:hypothetical protein
MYDMESPGILRGFFFNGPVPYLYGYEAQDRLAVPGI